MNVNKVNVEKLFIRFSFAFMLVLASFFAYFLVTGNISFGELENGWDGVTIARSFVSGNGTEDNPYIINSAEEYMYFKELIEGDSFSAYQDKYYALGNDIDFNGKEIKPIGVVKGEEEHLFKGHIDGRGYAIRNFIMHEGVEIDDVNYYGLFSKTVDVYANNIIIDNYSIIPDETLEKVVIGSFAGYIGDSKENVNTEVVDDTEEVENTELVEGTEVVENTEAVENNDVVEEEKEYLSEIKNISISNFQINVYRVKSEENSLNAFAGVVEDYSLIKNISINGLISNNKKNDVLSIIGNNLGDVSFVITDINVSDNSKIVFDKIENLYLLKNGSITLDGEEVSLDTLKVLFNDSIDVSNYYWEFVDNQFVIKRIVKEVPKYDEPSTVPIDFSFSISNSPAISLHATGIDTSAKTAYINDLDSDFNYYTGLNYTGGGTVNTTPSGNSYGLYSTSNLAKVYIAYKGSDINNTTGLVGYVSLAEQISDFVYYKYYPIESGYVTIPLIDNPYADRPDNKAFNGWVTDYTGAVVSLDSDIYTRYVKIPAPADPTSPISITMYASWTEATAIVASTNRGTLSTTGLKSVGMNQIATRTPVYDTNYPQLYSYNSMSSGTGNNGTAYPNGALNANGASLSGQRCTRIDRWTARTCYYYLPVAAGDVVVGGSYYQLVNNNMQAYTFTIIGYQVTSSILNVGDNVVGFFKKGVPDGSLVGYYNSTGVIQTSGSCSGNTCNNYYELIQYDSNTVLDENNYEFYYLVTRDTNIAYLTGNIGGFTNSLPVTVTGLNNGTNRSNYQVDLSDYPIYAGADLRVEYCSLYTGLIQPQSQGSAYGATNNIYGEYQNVKIGRGIPVTTGTYTTGGWFNQETHEGTYQNARGITGGNDSATGSAASPTRYSLIVESGYYNSISGVTPRGASTRNNFYVDANVTYGCDFDRITNTNSKLGVYYNATTTYGGVVRGGSNLKKYITTTIKSGKFGESTDEAASGVYVGGLTGGNIYNPAELIVEGGDIFNINGGPLISSDVKANNIIYIYMKGGRADFIFGGAALSTTYGNRIISVTGGQIDYAVFGGSNGTEGGNGDGTIDGDTFIYVGGTAVIGDDLNATAIWGVSPGSVFGVGNGNSSYSTIGSCNNSNIVIDNSATIKRNVYGGGNFGGVGSSSSTSAAATIKVNGGTVQGSVFGGSNTRGVIYGDTNITINGGSISNDVYGGGEGGYSSSSAPGTYVRDNVNVTVNSGTISGNVYGGSAYGSVNTDNENTTTSTSTTTVTINGGTITNSVFGGCKGGDKSPKVIGDITVNVNGGSMGKVFGGFDASGKPSHGDVVYLNGGTVGDAFGGGNNTNQDATDIRLQGSTITGNLYGGSNLLGTVTESHITVTDGSVTDIYGGNNLDGVTTTTNISVSGSTCTISGDIYGGGNEAESGVTHVDITGAAVHSVYGGGKKAGATTTNINIDTTTGTNVFGGSNVSGDVTTTNVSVAGSTFTALYGGNNQGGEASTTNLVTTSSTITNVFGGGDNAASGTSNVTVNSGTITNLYGGGNEAGVGTTNVTVANGHITNVYGGSNTSGNITTSNVNVGGNNIAVNVEYTKRAPGYYPQSNKPTYAEVKVTVINLTVETIEDWEISLHIPQAQVFSNISQSDINITGDDVNITSVNRYYGYNALTPGGSYVFEFSVLSDTALNQFDITGTPIRPTHEYLQDITIGALYGGNNQGGVTTTANVNATSGTIQTLYGGGNLAAVGSTNVQAGKIVCTDLYGGGNAAGVTGNTLVDVDGATINNNLYGGGNEGVVDGSTNVFVTDAKVLRNAFAGGNGSTAVVKTNSTITIDGSTEVGTASTVAPDAGCVFGSGNAASTGVNGTGGSVATVNIVGGKIHGNVYGGPKMAVVYGTTDTNIGTSAVNNNTLIEDDIIISGTVFGGGESNASGSETYDWTFISVTEGIDVNINGAGYITNNHDFIINGSIFGSGNASSSAGTSNITIKDLGSLDEVNKSISIQRASNLVIDHSVIELSGTTDRTNEYSDIKYSFNMIDKMTIKNGTTLLLQHNANLLKELYSGVDSGGNVVPATVDIDDDNKSVTKNVDNRIYMIPGQNLNVTITQDGNSYGKVTGMTFFGMYQAYDNGTYRFGLYDDDLDYGDPGNASLEIIGGSYVKGLHSVNHDITKDGFYSNFIEEDSPDEVTTAYIDPSTIGTTGYRWIIGFEAFTYNVNLLATKYSSLGTSPLLLDDFDDGNTIFTVLGIDTSGLNTDINLVDSDLVPRVARTPEIANSTLGLSMKAETQEWTSRDTTKFTNEGTGTMYGQDTYTTDSRQLAPSFMFYLYHAKNIDCEGDLGTAVITLRADIPKNQIDYDIKFLTITVTITARKFDDADSYDASITYDKRYELPSTTSVNITGKSQFSTYYSLIAWSDDFTKVYGRNNEYYHALVTNYALPVNTMITMMDFGANSNRPEYYYLRITQSMYDAAVLELQNDGEIVYRISNFIKMDSTSTTNTYSDPTMNHVYYDEDAGLVDEEFMFIFDFKETNQSGEHLNNYMLFELRNSENRTMFSVLGIRETVMFYNIYESSNVVLEQTLTDNDEYYYYNVPDEFTYSTAIMYNETDNRESVIDTNYESSKMGLNVSIHDRNGDVVSSSLLVGTNLKMDRKEYFADSDGVIRIKLADKVSVLNKNMSLTIGSDLPPDDYTLRFTLFASDDGLHNSSFANSVMEEYTIHVVDSDNSITVSCSDNTKVVEGETGLNMSNTAINQYTVKYLAQLSNPNVRIEVYKRNVDDINSITFTSVELSELFTNLLTRVSGTNEYYLNMDNTTQKSFDLNLVTAPTSGTYRLSFKLYDNDQLIDEDIKYVIVKKKSET